MYMVYSDRYSKEVLNMLNHNIARGVYNVYTKKTNTTDTDAAFNTGTLNYLVSTPSIILMIINASSEMLDQLLPADYITVGKKIELTHEQPTLVGETITVTVEVEEVIQNVVYLDFEVKDSKGVVCSGKYRRVIVEKSKLMEIAYKRLPELI